MPSDKDQEILSRLRKKETLHEGFDMLVRTYREKLYWMIRRIVIMHEDANDLVQNVFIKVWKNMDGFREDAKLSTWLYRIAVNEALALLKSRKFMNFIPLFSLEKKLADSLVDDQYFQADEIELKLQKTLLSLPSKQRLVFNMRYYDELSFEEISSILHTSESALKTSYHFAFQKIKKKLLSD